MNVVISPNIIKTKQRINMNGDVIDPKTKQVIQSKEAPYVPPTDASSSTTKADALGDRISQIINEKVAKIVEQKIEEALKNL